MANTQIFNLVIINQYYCYGFNFFIFYIFILNFLYIFYLNIAQT